MAKTSEWPPIPYQKRVAPDWVGAKKMTAQNMIAQNERPKPQRVDRVQAPAEGQAGATRRCRQVGRTDRQRTSDSQRQVLV